MNIFQKISLIRKTTKAIDEIKAVYEENSAVAKKIVEIINDLIAILERIKEVVPAVDTAVEAIINIIKKWLKKKK